MMVEWIIAMALPIIGWVASVEYRLGAVQGIKDTITSMDGKVDRVDSKVERLVEHLLGERSEQTGRDRPTAGGKG